MKNGILILVLMLGTLAVAACNSGDGGNPSTEKAIKLVSLKLSASANAKFTNSGTISVDFSTDKQLSKATATLGGQTVEAKPSATSSNWKATFSVKKLADDTYTGAKVTIDATDVSNKGAKGISLPSATGKVTVDTTQPQVESVKVVVDKGATQQDAQQEDTIKVTFTVSEDVEKTPVVRINNQPVVATKGDGDTWQASYRIPDTVSKEDKVPVVIELVDKAGNSDSNSISADRENNVVYTELLGLTPQVSSTGEVHGDKTYLKAQDTLTLAFSEDVSKGEKSKGFTIISASIGGITGEPESSNSVTASNSITFTNNSVVFTVADGMNGAVGDYTVDYTVTIDGEERIGRESGSLDGYLMDTDIPQMVGAATVQLTVDSDPSDEKVGDSGDTIRITFAVSEELDNAPGVAGAILSKTDATTWVADYTITDEDTRNGADNKSFVVQMRDSAGNANDVTVDSGIAVRLQDVVLKASAVHRADITAFANHLKGGTPIILTLTSEGATSPINIDKLVSIAGRDVVDYDSTVIIDNNASQITWRVSGDWDGNESFGAIDFTVNYTIGTGKKARIVNDKSLTASLPSLGERYVFDTQKPRFLGGVFSADPLPADKTQSIYFDARFDTARHTITIRVPSVTLIEGLESRSGATSANYRAFTFLKFLSDDRKTLRYEYEIQRDATYDSRTDGHIAVAITTGNFTDYAGNQLVEARADSANSVAGRLLALTKVNTALKAEVVGIANDQDVSVDVSFAADYDKHGKSYNVLWRLAGVDEQIPWQDSGVDINGDGTVAQIALLNDHTLTICVSEETTCGIDILPVNIDTTVTPALLGARIWYEARDPNADGTEPAHNSVVGVLRDKSGNNNHARPVEGSTLQSMKASNEYTIRPNMPNRPYLVPASDGSFPSYQSDKPVSPEATDTIEVYFIGRTKETAIETQYFFDISGDSRHALALSGDNGGSNTRMRLAGYGLELSEIPPLIDKDSESGWFGNATTLPLKRYNGWQAYTYKSSTQRRYNASGDITSESSNAHNTVVTQQGNMPLSRHRADQQKSAGNTGRLQLFNQHAATTTDEAFTGDFIAFIAFDRALSKTETILLKQFIQQRYATTSTFGSANGARLEGERTALDWEYHPGQVTNSINMRVPTISLMPAYRGPDVGSVNLGRNPGHLDKACNGDAGHGIADVVIFNLSPDNKNIGVTGNGVGNRVGNRIYISASSASGVPSAPQRAFISGYRETVLHVACSRTDFPMVEQYTIEQGGIRDTILLELTSYVES